MAAQGRKRTLYVGGLEDSVTEEIVFAAFVPFGDLKEVSLPKDFGDKTKSMKHKGFAFVEFEEAEDAQDTPFVGHAAPRGKSSTPCLY